MAFSEQMAWEVRSTGSDGNGGGFRGGWSISPPPAPTLNSGTGGAIGAGTYYFVLTYAQLDGAPDSGGKGTLQTPHGPEATITVAGSSIITITSPANPLAGDPQNRGLGDVTYCAWVSTTTGGPYHPVNSNGVSNNFNVKCGTNNALTNNFSPLVNDFGPPGTDYSQQDGVQITYTDLVIDGANNQKLTSVAHPGTVDLVGNTINVTSGTGFTVQRLEIVNVDGAGAYYVDKSAGTLGSTAGHGVLGGGLASIGLAGALLEIGVDSGAVFVKAGTYTCANTQNVSGGRFHSDSNNIHVIAYNSNRTTYNRDGQVVTLNAGAINMHILEIGRNYSVVANFILNANGNSGVTGAICYDRNILFRDCQTVGCNPGFDTQSHGICYVRCFSNADAGAGFNGGSNGNAASCLYFACVANVQGNTGFSLNGGCFAINCVAYCNGGTGFHSDAEYNVFAYCTAYDTAGTIGTVGFTTNNSATGIASMFINCVASNFSGAGSGGFTMGAALPTDRVLNCSGYNNTRDLTGVWGVTIEQFFHLTGDPFVNAAGKDFGLNNTAGAGKTLRGGGMPGHAALTQLPGGVVADAYPDVGAIQTSSLQAGMLVHPGYSGGMKG